MRPKTREAMKTGRAATMTMTARNTMRKRMTMTMKRTKKTRRYRLFFSELLCNVSPSLYWQGLDANICLLAGGRRGGRARHGGTNPGSVEQATADTLQQRVHQTPHI